MSHIQQITLDLIPNGEMPILYASQYDAGRSFRANIVERKIPYTLDGTELISLTVRKGDGNLVTMDIANTFADKTYIDFLSTEQMTAISGSNFGELHLESNGVSIGTLNFYLTVEPAADEGGIESESEINNLERQVHEIVIDEIAEDLSHYYTKEETYSSEEIDNALDLKANASDVYDKAEIDTALALKANTSDVNTALALKADKATTYDKTEVDNLVAPKADKSYVDSELATKADQATTYSKTEVDALINALPTPMVFKGTLGTGGTITTLPTASAENEGYTYKVITDGTYQGIVCKVGDVVTSNGSDWVLIPSGDTDSDTWRAIKINGTEKLSNAISSGAVDFEQGDNITITFDANGNKIIVATTGIYTKAEVDALIAGKCDYPTETASGAIASFNTDLASALKECEVSFTAYQASGTPTPSTPIPISGFSSATITREDNNHGNQYSVVIPFGDTYYGGVLDVVRGSGVSDTDIYTFTGSENWIFNDANNYWYFSLASVARPKTSGELVTTENGIVAKMYDGGSRGLPRIYLSDNPSITSGTDMTTIFTSGQKIAFKSLETKPITTTPTVLTTISGDNNVFCDIPTSSVEVAFKVSIEKYINDLLNP